MYYITVSNGLLSPQHKKKMGSAVWEFMWCLDKMTKIDDQGRGVVLGGKPVKLGEIGMGHDNTTSTNMHKLEREGYVTIVRTPFGMVIYINKPKKKFSKPSTENSDSQKPVNHKKSESPTENSGSPTENSGYKEDNTDDITDDNTGLPVWLNKKVWEEWVQDRKDRKKKLTSRAIQLQLKKLEEFGIENHVQIIKNSIESGWQTFYALKKENKNARVIASQRQASENTDSEERRTTKEDNERRKILREQAESLASSHSVKI